MRRRFVGLGAGAVLLAGATWVACGSEPDSTPSTGGADAGGGTAGSGGGGVGGGGAPGGGGNGGSGGSAGDGGTEWGADPKWEPTGQSAAGCPIERLANPNEVKALVWKACSWAADCEEAVFNPQLLGAGAVFNPTSSVHDDGAVARIALAVISPKPRVVVADATGQALDGFLSPTSALNCWLPSVSVWGKRLAALAGPVGDTDHGGLLVDVGSKSLTAFTVNNPPVGGPQRTPLGEKRWLWWWVPVDRFSTVSATDGSGFQIFASAATLPVVGYSQPIAAGEFFFFDEFEAIDGGATQRKIAWSDGLTAPKPYVVAPDPNDDFGSAAYAHTSMVFLKGIGRIGISKFKSVEVWTSPYSGDPNNAKPSFFASFPIDAMARIGAGFGKMASPTSDLPTGELKIEVWDLATKSSVAHPLPKDHVYKALLGVSRDHVYIAAAKPNAGPSAYLVRYPVS